MYFVGFQKTFSYPPPPQIIDRDDGDHLIIATANDTESSFPKPNCRSDSISLMARFNDAIFDYVSN